MAERWCSRANHYVEEDQFRMLKNGKLSSWCRACHRENSREYRARMMATPESAAAYRKHQRENGRRWAKKNIDKKRKSSREQKARRRAAGLSDKEVTRAWRKANPDKARKHHQDYMEKLKADPDRYAAFLEMRRFQYRMRRMEQGIPVRPMAPRRPAKEQQMRIPREPLTRFLEGVIVDRELTYREIGLATGIHIDQIRGILNRKYDRVAIATVDNCLTTFDGPPLRSLYPDL